MKENKLEIKRYLINVKKEFEPSEIRMIRINNAFASSLPKIRVFFKKNKVINFTTVVWKTSFEKNEIIEFAKKNNIELNYEEYN